MWDTGTIRRPFVISDESSSTSFSFSFGMRTVFMPALPAARSFSFSPPMGRTLPAG